MIPEDFNEEIKNASSEEEFFDFCRKKVLHGTPFVFADEEDHYYEFRKLISKKFEIPFHQIYITGSGKLGFSLNKGTTFSLNSDIDVALISESLFLKYMNDIRQYQYAIRNSEISLTSKELQMYHSFLEYVAIGWMRPDKLPASFNIKVIKQDWFDFFNSISYGKSCVGNYKVSAGLFQNYQCFEEYTVISLKSYRQSLLGNQVNGKSD